MRATTIGCSALLVMACTDSAGQGSAVASDDSWRLEAQPVVVIGDENGDPESLLHLVRFVGLVQDERVVVTDASNTIRVFDLDGELRRRFAGEGEGPSEIRFHISGAWIAPPDTVHVVDGRVVRTFLLDGSFQRSRQLEGSVWAEVLVGVFGDGGMVFTGLWPDAETRVDGDVVREGRRYQRVSPEGEDLGVLAWGSHRITYPSVRQSGPAIRSGVGNRQHPLGPHSSALIGGDTMFIAEGLRPEITVVAKEGDTARVIPVPGHTLSYEEARDSLRTALRIAGRQDRIAGLDAAPVLDSVPRTAGMLMDDEGLLWVKRFDPATDSNTMLLRQWFSDPSGGEWWVIDRAGDVRATVTLPDRFIPMDVGTTLIAGITVDELGVERVVVYRIGNRK